MDLTHTESEAHLDNSRNYILIMLCFVKRVTWKPNLVTFVFTCIFMLEVLVIFNVLNIQFDCV